MVSSLFKFKNNYYFYDNTFVQSVTTKTMAFEISVFLKNKITHLEVITNILKDENINIRSMTLISIYQGWGVVKLLVDQPEKAYKILSDQGDSVSMREIIALEMKDESGGLDELLIKISRAGIHIESAYSRLISETKMALLILEVPDVLVAVRRLEINGLKTLEDEIVYGR
jgi:hypothetical protein